jgi:hypothetical protein
MREADLVVLFTRATLEQVAHLRERVAALTSDLRGGPPIGIVVLADPRDFRASIAEVDRIITGVQGRTRSPDVTEPGPAAPPVAVLGGLALDPKGAELLSGRWGGRLDRSLLIRSAREVAGTLIGHLGPVQAPNGPVAPQGPIPSYAPPYPQPAQPPQPPPAPQPYQEQGGPERQQFQEGRR